MPICRVSKVLRLLWETPASAALEADGGTITVSAFRKSERFSGGICANVWVRAELKPRRMQLAAVLFSMPKFLFVSVSARSIESFTANSSKTNFSVASRFVSLNAVWEVLRSVMDMPSSYLRFLPSFMLSNFAWFSENQLLKESMRRRPFLKLSALCRNLPP